MHTLEINLPDQLIEFVHTRVAAGGHQSVSEYICELLRADQRKLAWAALETEVAKGIDSGPAVPMTAEDWASIRAEVRGRIEDKSKSAQ